MFKRCCLAVALIGLISFSISAEEPIAKQKPEVVGLALITNLSGHPIMVGSKDGKDAHPVYTGEALARFRVAHWFRKPQSPQNGFPTTKMVERKFSIEEQKELDGSNVLMEVRIEGDKLVGGEYWKIPNDKELEKLRAE